MPNQSTTELEERIRARIPPAPSGVPSYRRELAVVVARIVARFRPERVILFGSRAYGSPHAGSDVDLMVVADPPLPAREQLWDIQRGLDGPIPRDIHTRTLAQIRLGLAEHDFFIEDVMSGATLYERKGSALSATGAGEDGTAGNGSARIKQATQAWLRTSEDDYRAALTLFHGGYPLYDQVCFQAQQSVEKLLKALLQEREIRSRRTHNLRSCQPRATSRTRAGRSQTI